MALEKAGQAGSLTRSIGRTEGALTMWPDRIVVIKGGRSSGDEDHRVRMRSNALAAIVVAVLLMSGAWLADELSEDSRSCYPPDGGCEATGVPAPQPADYFQ
jgi:hypothetical protein